MKRLNRKTVVLAAVALLLGGGAYLNYMQAQRAAESQMSDLTLANLEAMALTVMDHESFEGQRSRTEKCPNGTTRVYCVTGNGICVIQDCK